MGYFLALKFGGGGGHTGTVSSQRHELFASHEATVSSTVHEGVH